MAQPGLRLLSLDGGGVRGLSSLYILQAIMWKVADEPPDGQRRILPKPCDYFDLIGGTSTGGLIAIMLGRLKMTVDECIDAYITLAHEVFSQPRLDKQSRWDKSRKKISALVGKEMKANFSAADLERIVKELLRKRNIPEDALLEENSKCKVFVCAVSDSNGEPVLFKSYATNDADDLIGDTKIWQACRATSAAKTFFDPIEIGSEKFSDGGLRYNNPMRLVWDEACRIHGIQSIDLHKSIDCFVSIGTGVPEFPREAENRLPKLIKLLQQIATETENTAKEFHREKSSLYQNKQCFRFNVSNGLQGIGLDEADKQARIKASTRAYLRDEGTRIKAQDCADALARRVTEGQVSVAEEVRDVGTARDDVDRFNLTPSLAEVMATSHFVARDEELAEIHRLLCRRPGRQTVVVHGLGGMGKTQLAIAYMQRHRTTLMLNAHDETSLNQGYTASIWLNARDETSLKQSFRNAATRISREYPELVYMQAAVSDKESDASLAVKRWLDEPRNDRWLLVYDNYDNPKMGSDKSDGWVTSGRSPAQNDELDEATVVGYDIRNYLPETDHGAVIVTSRSSTIQIGELIRLQKLRNVEDSLSILESTSGRTGCTADPSAVALARKLDGLPLALSTAGAYLSQLSTSWQQYLRDYEAAWVQLQRLSPQMLTYENRAMYSTWNVSYESIRRQNEPAAMLLRLWAYFGHEDLWYELLREGDEDKPAWLRSLTETQLAFDAGMRVLCSHGLIEAQPGGTQEEPECSGYSVHACVHSWMIHVLNDEQEQDLAALAVDIVACHVPGEDAPKYWLIQRRLLLHANRTRELLERMTDGDSREAWWSVRLGLLYFDQGQLDNAEAMYERALHGFEEASGRDHTTMLHAINNLGNVYTRQGRHAGAEAMYERALRGKEKVFGGDHISTLQTIANLGYLHTNQGRFDDAERMYMRALQGREKVLGREDWLTLNTFYNLGILYRLQGRLGEAEVMQERTLQGTEQSWGRDHMLTLDTVNSLGTILMDQERFTDAEAMLKRALQGYEKALGEEHISTFDTVSDLGVLYKRQGRLDDAEAMYKRALQGYEKALGKNGTKTYVPFLNTITNLGLLYEELGRQTESRECYEKALQGCRKVFGHDSDHARRLEKHLYGSTE